MIALNLSGILYECDGAALSARVLATGAAFGPTPLSEASVQADGSWYVVVGDLHSLLSEQAVAILRGLAPLPVEPEPEVVVAPEPEVVVAPEPEVVVAPKADAPHSPQKRR